MKRTTKTRSTQKNAMAPVTNLLAAGAATVAMTMLGCAPAGDPNSLVATDAAEVESLLGKVPKANHNIVAIDSSHTRQLNLAGRHRTLTSLLVTEGYTVLPKELGNDPLLAVLRGTAGTVIVDMPDIAFTDRELLALESFVFWGGRLIVLMDSVTEEGGPQLLERFGLSASAVNTADTHEDSHWFVRNSEGVVADDLNNQFKVDMNDIGLLPRLSSNRHLVFTRPLQLAPTGSRNDSLEYTELLTIRGKEEDATLPVGFQVNHKLTADLATPDSDVDAPSPYKGKIFVVGSQSFASEGSTTNFDRCLNRNVNSDALQGGILTAENCFGALALVGGPRQNELVSACNDVTPPIVNITANTLPEELVIDLASGETADFPRLSFEACDDLGITQVNTGFTGANFVSRAVRFDSTSATGDPTGLDRNNTDFRFVFDDNDAIREEFEAYATANNFAFAVSNAYEIRVQDSRGNARRLSIPVRILNPPIPRTGRLILQSALPGENPPEQGVTFGGPIDSYPNQNAFGDPLATRNFNGPSYPHQANAEDRCVCKNGGLDDDNRCGQGQEQLNMATEVRSNDGDVANVVGIEGFPLFEQRLRDAGWPDFSRLSWAWTGPLVAGQTPTVDGGNNDLPPELRVCLGSNTTEVRRYENQSAESTQFELKLNGRTLLSAPMPDLRIFLAHGLNQSCDDDAMCAETTRAIRDLRVANDLTPEETGIARAFIAELAGGALQIEAVIFDRIERDSVQPFFLGVDPPWLPGAQGYHVIRTVVE